MPSYRKSGINKFITKNLALVLFLVIGLVAALAVSLVSTELRPQASNLTEQLARIRQSTPAPTAFPSCGNNCNYDSQCGTGLQCLRDPWSLEPDDICLNPACSPLSAQDDDTCICNVQPTPTPLPTATPTPAPTPWQTCGSSCTYDGQCATGLRCVDNPWRQEYGNICLNPACSPITEQNDTTCACTNAVNTITATGEASCNNRVTLRWTTTFSDAPYKIYRCIGPACIPQPNQLIGQTNALTYVDNGPLKAGSTYNYRIDSVHVSGSTFGKVKITLPKATLVCPIDN